MGEDTSDFRIQVIKTRLNPGVKAEQLLFSYTGATNAVYNTMLYLSGRTRAYREWQLEHNIPEHELVELIPVFSAYGLSKHINAIKADVWFWSDQVSKHVFEDAARNLSAAFGKFKQSGYKHYPRYHRRHENIRAGRHSVSFVEVKRKWLDKTGSRIDLPAPAAVKRDWFGLNSKQSIQIPVSKDRRMRRAAKLIHAGRATVQQVTYSYSGGYWWASIRLRVMAKHARQYHRPTTPARQTGEGLRVLGVDASLAKHTWAAGSTSIPGYTDPDGSIRLPAHMKNTYEKLQEAQRWYSRTTPGSNRRDKALLKVQKLNHKLAAQRRGFTDGLSNTLLQSFDVVTVEDLSLDGMSRRKPGRRLSFGHAVGNSAHGLFRQLLETKQHRYNGAVQLVVADRWFPSSKRCSGCGAVKAKLLLSSRIYKCGICGLILDRDVNAANNLAWYGLRSVTGQVATPRGSYTGNTGTTGVESKQVDDKTRTDTQVFVQAATLPVST